MHKSLYRKFEPKIMTDIYIYREREKKNRIFGVNGFEFYEVFLDIRTLKNKFLMMTGFLGHE